MKLEDIVGKENVLRSKEDRICYSYDAQLKEALPDAIVIPEDKHQIAEVLKYANREGIPVIPRGAGTGLAGGSVPVEGGIVMLLKKLDRIASSINSQESFVTAMELHGFALDRADMDEIRNYIAYKVNSTSDGTIVDTSVFSSAEQVKRNLKRLSGSNAEFDVAVLEGITSSDWGQVQSSKRLEKVLGDYLQDNKKTIANKVPLTEALEKSATAYNTDTQRGRTYIAHKDSLGIFYLFSKVGNGDANLIDKFTSFEELSDNVSPLMDLWEV